MLNIWNYPQQLKLIFKNLEGLEEMETEAAKTSVNGGSTAKLEPGKRRATKAGGRAKKTAKNSGSKTRVKRASRNGSSTSKPRRNNKK